MSCAQQVATRQRILQWFDTMLRHPYITGQTPTPLKNMSSRRNFRPGRPHAFTRVLSLLLLGFIFYGTTLEAAHKHGRGGEPSTKSRGAVVQETGTTSNTGGLATDSECLICQLHQNFSTAVTSARQVSPLQAPVREVFLTTFTNLQTRQTTTCSGRAPPSQQETA